MEEVSRNEIQEEFYKAVNETIGVKSRHKNITSTQLISKIEDSNDIMEPETRSTLLDDLEKSLDYDEEGEKPTCEEVAKACKDMKNGKAPGSDGIASETWKDKSLQPLLLKIVQYVWEKDEIPNEWNLSLINAIPKKKGFRTVSIINSAAKVYAKILNN